MTFNSRIPYNGLPPLPPAGALETPEVLRQLAIASRYLGELNGVAGAMAEPGLLINTLAMQESKLSAAIENISTTQDELYEAITGIGDVTPAAIAVLNGTEALYVGWELMNKRKNIISTNTMVEIAQVISGSPAGIRDTPATPVKHAITGTIIYMPPEGAPVIREKLGDLERFINDNNYSNLDPLIKMAMIHYQFRAIQPFAAGTGRIGSILNELYLMHQGLLPHPVLYLSGHIAQNKILYEHLLQGVTEQGNWQDWILYNLAGIGEAAKRTTSKIKRIISLKRKMDGELKQVLGSSYKQDLLQLLFELPYVKIELLVKRDMAHRQTAATWLKKLVAAGILAEQKKSKTLYFVNDRLMRILTD